MGYSSLFSFVAEAIIPYLYKKGEAMPKYMSFDELRGQMQSLELRLKDTEPLMAHIANTLALFTSQSFEKETSPFGEKWKPLSSVTLKKSKGLKKKLVDKGKLVNSIHTSHTTKSASIGTSVVYARIHQFGGKAGRNHKVIIPARPFIPISKEDKIPKALQEEIQELAMEHILGVFLK
ncbi:phage virion morphogenesis protein [Helicobacter typhlonius]|uniref:Phage virion morphogenesis protein n=2 Tax=Helicobacter typhlonius TaxID=76936 RepID=A0A4U8RYR2_9HELI|nr:phage virion morphogenesis protein [Helicobacter typhlonius]